MGLTFVVRTIFFVGWASHLIHRKTYNIGQSLFCDTLKKISPHRGTLTDYEGDKTDTLGRLPSSISGSVTSVALDKVPILPRSWFLPE